MNEFYAQRDVAHADDRAVCKGFLWAVAVNMFVVYE
jgi:hypothetical protein